MGEKTRYVILGGIVLKYEGETYYKCLNVLNRIEEMRIKRGLSGYAFSRLLGCTKAYWCIKYTQATLPRFSTLNHMAKVLDVSLDYLLHGGNCGKYEEVTLDFKDLANKLYYKMSNIKDDLSPTLSYIRSGRQHDLSLLLYFRLEERLKTNLLKGSL